LSKLKKIDIRTKIQYMYQKLHITIWGK